MGVGIDACCMTGIAKGAGTEEGTGTVTGAAATGAHFALCCDNISVTVSATI